MDIETNDIYEAFGLEAPQSEPEAEEPGTGPDASNPEGAETEQQEEGAETEPAQQDAGDEPEPAEEPEGEGGSAEAPADEGQRTAQEFEPAVQAAMDAHYAAAFAGKRNPFTGKEIRSRADFEEYMQAKEERDAQLRRDAALEKVRAAGLDAETLQALFSETPLGREMQRAAQFSRQMEQENYNRLISKAIADDIAEIAKYDPSVKDVDTLKATARGKEIEARVKSGKCTWLEAWKLENFERISGARAEAAKQAAINAANSKDHLQSTAQRGSGEVEIPARTRSMFEAFGITDPDKQRDEYAKYLNSIRKGS